MNYEFTVPSYDHYASMFLAYTRPQQHTDTFVSKAAPKKGSQTRAIQNAPQKKKPEPKKNVLCKLNEILTNGKCECIEGYERSKTGAECTKTPVSDTPKSAYEECLTQFTEETCEQYKQ